MVSGSCGRNSLIRVVAIAAAGSGLYYGSSNPDSSELYVQFFFFNVCILRFKLTEASELERFFAQNDFFLWLMFKFNNDYYF